MSDTTDLALRVRPLAWTDLGRLAELETALFADDAWSEATWWAELAARPRRDYVVAEWVPVAEGAARAAEAPAGPDNGSAAGAPRIAGYAGVDLGRDTADVMTVAVDAAYRGRGVGDLLLGRLIARAASHGAGALLLEVRADNASALALYRRHGFEQVSVRRRYYQPADVDALVLRRLLHDLAPRLEPSPDHGPGHEPSLEPTETSR